jgi:hypothetical protein
MCPAVRTPVLLIYSVVVAVLAAVAACSEPARLTPTPVGTDGRWHPPTNFVAEPESQARVDAQAALAAGRPYRIHFGMISLTLTDPATGLPIAEYGCEVTEMQQAYTYAYNAAVDEGRAAGGIAAGRVKTR